MSKRNPRVYSGSINFVSLTALAGILGYAVFQGAGVGLDDRNVCLIAVGTVCFLHFAFTRHRDVPKLDRFSAVSVSAFLGLAALQLVPLPVGVIRVLSPARAELVDAAAPFTGGMPGYAQLSAVPFNTAEYLIMLIGYATVLLLVRNILFHTPTLPWAPVWPLLTIALLEAVLGIYQTYAGAGSQIAKGTYTNRNHFAGLLEMVLPFAVMYPVAILQRGRKRQESAARPALKACGVIAIAAMLLVGTILSASRMGFMVSLAVLFVSGSVASAGRGWRVGYVIESVSWRRWLPSLPIATVAVLGFIYLPTNLLIGRFSELAREDLSADTRVQIWRDTAGLIRSYPLCGCGLGGYESCFYRYKKVSPMNTGDYAHEDYLQVLAEIGIVGFAAGLLFVLHILFRTARGTLYAHSVDDRYVNIACVASITGVLLHSFVDFNMYIPSNAMAVAWVLGIAGVNLRGQRGSRNRLMRLDSFKGLTWPWRTTITSISESGSA